MASDNAPVANTAQRIGRLEAEVEAISGSVRTLAEEFRSFAREVRSSSRTNWGWIFASVGVIVSIVGGLLVLGARGPLSDLDAIKAERAAIQAREIQDAYHSGQREERIAALERAIRASSKAGP